MDSGALFVGNGPECGRNVEYLCWVDNLAAVSDDGQEAEDKAEAVEERRRATQDV